MNSKNHNSTNNCHICNYDQIINIDNFGSLPRTTSDARPWKRGGKLAYCSSCGCVQKVFEKNYIIECETIYSNYSIYHQSQGGQEQLDFKENGTSICRSARVLKSVINKIDLPNEGKLLDVGCGNGNLLKSCSKLLPSLSLYGHDINIKFHEFVSSILNVKTFYTDNINTIDECFDIITLHHTLEHIINPIKFLKNIQNLIHQEGYLIISVPDFIRNPFDLIVADHCSHFQINSIEKVLGFAGFKTVLIDNSFPQKDLTIVAKKAYAVAGDLKKMDDKLYFEKILKVTNWLFQTREEASKIALKRKFGLFGASLSSLWLMSDLKNYVEFVVDEDKNKIGQQFFECQIVNLTDLPEDANIYLPFSYNIACLIKKRLSRYNVNFYLPPPLMINIGDKND